MEIEKKYMSKKDWNRASKRKYICKTINKNNTNGKIGLLYIEKVTSPCFKRYDNDINIKIADDNYYWLQMAIENKNYWITAMYNNRKELIQYYIDITQKNVIKNDGDSYFYDLFLDIVFLSNGKIILLDEDELKKALEEKSINKQQYNMAYEVANNIIKFLPKEKSKLDQFCTTYLQILEKDLIEKEKNR